MLNLVTDIIVVPTNRLGHLFHFRRIIAAQYVQKVFPNNPALKATFFAAFLVHSGQFSSKRKSSTTDNAVAPNVNFRYCAEFSGQSCNTVFHSERSTKILYMV